MEFLVVGETCEVYPDQLQAFTGEPFIALGPLLRGPYFLRPRHPSRDKNELMCTIIVSLLNGTRRNEQV